MQIFKNKYWAKGSKFTRAIVPQIMIGAGIVLLWLAAVFQLSHNPPPMWRLTLGLGLLLTFGSLRVYVLQSDPDQPPAQVMIDGATLIALIITVWGFFDLMQLPERCA